MAGDLTPTYTVKCHAANKVTFVSLIKHELQIDLKGCLIIF